MERFDIRLISKIPLLLREKKAWINWAVEIRDGKETKVPYIPGCRGARASSTDETTWRSFDEAVNYFQEDSSMAGIGFVFKEDSEIVGIDFDDCVKDGKFTTELAKKYFTKFNSYTEISPSGTGFKTWIFGIKPGTLCRKTVLGSDVEVYEKGRFFCVTGMRCSGSSPNIEEGQDVLNELWLEVFGKSKVVFSPSAETVDAPNPVRAPVRAPKKVSTDEKADRALVRMAAESELYDGDGFREIWFGRYQGVYASSSNARQSLLNRLAFWTNGDVDRMERIFKKSPLYAERKQKLEIVRSSGKTFCREQVETAKSFWEEHGKVGFEGEVPEEYTLNLKTGERSKTPIISSQISQPSQVPTAEETIINDWISSDLVWKAIEGTYLGDVVDTLRSFDRNKTPVQISLGHAIFALGCAMSGERTDSSKYHRGSDRAKIRIYGTVDALTGAVYVVLLALAGTGKDCSNITGQMDKDGLKTVTDASGAGLLDAAKDFPNLGIYFPEFQKVLQNSDFNADLIHNLKIMQSRFWYEKALRFDKKAKEGQGDTSRRIDYVSLSVLGASQPIAIQKYLLDEHVEDGFVDRFLFCNGEEVTLTPRPCVVDTKRMHEIFIHFQHLQGDFYFAEGSPNQNGFDSVYNSLTKNGNIDYLYEARIVNLNAAKLAIMMQGSLDIQPAIWKRVEVLLRLFAQNRRTVIANTFADKFDAKIAAKHTKILCAIRKVEFSSGEKSGANKRLLYNISGAIRTRSAMSDALSYLTDAGLIYFDKSSKEYRTVHNKKVYIPFKAEFEPVTMPPLIRPSLGVELDEFRGKENKEQPKNISSVESLIEPQVDDGGELFK
jgi:hypothetical protein